MLDSLWQVLVSISLVFISLEQIRLRREVQKCLDVFYQVCESVQEVSGDE